MEALIKHYIENHKESLNRLIEYGKGKVKSGEMTESEYKSYLLMTLQGEVESLLETKLDIAIPE